MLSETRIIVNAKQQNVFGSLKVIISSNFNTKLVNISIDYIGQSSSHLIILAYNLHIQHNLACLSHTPESLTRQQAHICMHAYMHILISCGRLLTKVPFNI